LFFVLGMTMVPLWAAQIFNGAGAVAQAATSAVGSAVSAVGTAIKAVATKAAA
jgi:hypothetical protein